jgi:hypothetical protein
VDLTEIELREVTRSARRSTGATAYTGLQLGHRSDNLIALVEIVAVDVDGTWSAYKEAEIYHIVIRCV